MLSKNKIKLIQSLSRKKNRDESGLFLAEGFKLVDQLKHSNYDFHTIIAPERYIVDFLDIKCEKVIATCDEIKKISLLKTPQDIVAVCYQKNIIVEASQLQHELVLALDDIQDPGNLGTIIRLASWFGIQHVICSAHTVDCYNPKAIQASMGAIAQVSVFYTQLDQFIQEAKQNGISIYGTFLEGKNIYESTLENKGIVVLGNEGNGISDKIKSLVDQQIVIPSFAARADKVESLNVSMATSIICSEFRRRVPKP
jgi:RNA methyltransferase, TrmH family